MVHRDALLERSLLEQGQLDRHVPVIEQRPAEAEDRRVGEEQQFVEKPRPEQIDTNLINAGAYILERSVLDVVAPGRAVSIEREVFPALVGKGLFGFEAPVDAVEAVVVEAVVVEATDGN